MSPEIFEELVSRLTNELTLDIERALRQRDESLKTGTSTASHGGSHDTCTTFILRKHLQPLWSLNNTTQPSLMIKIKVTTVAPITCTMITLPESLRLVPRHRGSVYAQS